MEAPRAAIISATSRHARMPSFFRDVAANGEPGAFFAAQRDFIFADELADVLEAHGV